MIVQFSVSNYRSFLDEQTLSLVASKRLGDAHSEHLCELPDSDQSVLRTAVLYGANGAGKSNLFNALGFLRRLVLKTRKKGAPIGRTAFIFEGAAGTPSTMELTFVVGEQVYRFGCDFNDEQILAEWLLRVVGSKEQVVYERTTGEDDNAVVTPGKGLKVGFRLRAMIKVGGPGNQTFLSTVRANLQRDDITDELNAVIDWFRDLTLISPDQPFAPVGHMLTEDPAFLEFAGDFLRYASTGVDHLTVEKREISRDELKKLVPEEIVDEILTSTKTASKNLPATVVGSPDGAEYILEAGDGGHFYKVAVNSAHRSKKGLVPIPLHEESDGTRRLLELLPALYTAKTKGSTFFIDEIDRSLHPSLIHKFMKFFIKTCSSGQQQVIITTHESSLLDLELLRRDEIWFAEKDKRHATHLFSLSDFKVRTDAEIRRNYLKGRFGAIPFLANVDRLLTSEGI